MDVFLTGIELKCAPVQLSFDFAETFDEGLGLVMSGGLAAFGPGGYHDTEVARILVALLERRTDAEIVAAALLHDVVEDTEWTVDDLRKHFDDEIAYLVDGVTKLAYIDTMSKMGSRDIEVQEAESLRKMFLAMVDDVRVVLIKLADRLHNMRTLGVLQTGKARRIARETLDIYAPIAMRLGMNNVRMEFEYLGFSALHPMRARRIEAARRSARGHRKELVEQIRQHLRRERFGSH